MKKALVTGANGFVGSALVRELVKNNVEVIALDRDGCNNIIPKNVRFVAHELSESSKLADIIPDRDIDVFYPIISIFREESFLKEGYCYISCMFRASIIMNTFLITLIPVSYTHLQ